MCPRNAPTNPDGSQPPRKRHFLSYKRRWLIWGSLFLVLGLLIFYNWATQDHRVRAVLEQELTSVVGGPVTIGHAEFSIVRGLQVRDVTVSVDDEELDDSLLMKADELFVSLNYARLLQRRVDLERIEATDVHITLVEDAVTGRWNFARLLDRMGDAMDEYDRDGPSIAPPSSIPAIQISNTRVTYLRRQDQQLVRTGELVINGNVFPMPEKRLGFQVITDPAGDIGRTVVVGLFDARAGEITGRISELHFDHALRRMLPLQVRSWFDELDFAGRFSVPRFSYRVGELEAEQERFALDFSFEDTRATVHPRHWMTLRDRNRMGVIMETIRALEMMDLDAPLAPGVLVGNPDDDVFPVDVLGHLALRARMIPLHFSEINGLMRLTDRKIQLEQLGARIQGQAIEVIGEINGYHPDATGLIRLNTAPGTYITVPPSRQFMAWLPEDVRRAYLQFKPQGKGIVHVQLERETEGAPIEPVAIVSVFQTQMEFEDFPYPLRDCTGDFIFSHDPVSGEDVLKMQLKGYGVLGGPNENSTVEISGTIGPFIRGGPGIDVRVDGKSITSELEIRKAFPREVAKAMQMFGPPDYGHRLAASDSRRVELSEAETLAWPQFFGDFDVHIERAAGPRKSVNTNVNLDLKRASGSLKAFPYPMHDLQATVKIVDDGPGENHLELVNLRMNRNDAELTLWGKVRFTDPVDHDIHVDALNVPIDDDLLSALPPTERAWIRKAALGGRVDIKGRVFAVPGPGIDEASVDFALALNMRDADLWRDANGPAFTHINGPVKLAPARLEFTDLVGRRGDAKMHFTGMLDWADGTPDVDLKAAAENLLLDKTLRDILPPAAQSAYDANNPEGTTDLSLHYVIKTPPAVPGEEPESDETIDLTLRPRALAATPDVFEYRLENLGGAVHVKGNHVRLEELTGEHGPTRVRLNGEGVVGDKTDFLMQIAAEGVVPDAELLHALPEGVADLLKSLEAAGSYDVTFDRFHVRHSPPRRVSRAARAGGDTNVAPTTAPATQGPQQAPLDIDFDVSIATRDGELNVGMPVTEMVGSTHLVGEVRESSLVRLDGSLGADTYKLMGRAGSDLTATIRRPQHLQGTLIQSLKSRFSGGAISGDVTLLTPEDGPSQYAVSMLIQNADMAGVAGDAMSKPFEGRLSASFDVEGVMGDTRNRRGRGNVSISGQGMYEAPIILGFFRLVNFALPVRDGVNQIDLSYTLMQDRATFDSIEMTAPGLRIYGDGVLDFARRTLNFTLKTENPDAWPVPLINQLVRRAREELLQINITGTIQEPEVKARTLPTFQTTIDQVLQDVRSPRR